MTRINTVPPRVLTDAHLLTEIRELPRVPNLVLKRLRNGSPIKPSSTQYTMGGGHVVFFYDKIKYLFERLQELHEEADKRGFDQHRWDDSDTRWEECKSYPECWNDWEPDDNALITNWGRLNEKIISSNVKPRWYRRTYEKEFYLEEILDTVSRFEPIPEQQVIEEKFTMINN